MNRTHGASHAKVTVLRTLAVLLGLAVVYFSAPMLFAQPAANKVFRSAVSASAPLP